MGTDGEDYSEEKQSEDGPRKESTTDRFKIRQRRSSVWQNITRANTRASNVSVPRVAFRANSISGITLDVDEDAFEQECNNHVEQGGVLVDFVQRLSGWGSGAGSFSASTKRLVRHPIGTQEKLLAWAGYFAGRDAAAYDSIYTALMEDITIFWKAIGNTQWKSDKDLLPRRIVQLTKYYREAKCLRAEVDTWHFRQSLLNTKPRFAESVQERHGRLQQFWADFHESSRKTEPRAIRPPFKDDLRRRVYRDNLSEIPPESRKCKVGVKALRDLRLKNRGGSIGHDLDWKNRSVRSKVSAGTWDWAHGSPMLSHCSVRASTKKRHEHWSTSLFDISDEELEEYADPVPGTDEDEIVEGDDVSPGASPVGDTFLTDVSSRPLTPQASRPQSSMGMSMKAASVPNLKKLTAAFGPESLRPSSSQSFISFDGSLSDGTFLPPVSNKFSVPWQNSSPDPVLKCTDTPTKRYLRACHKGKSVPRPLPFITGHSLKFNASGQSLFDKDLAAVTVTLEDLGIEEVDLTDNTSLSERSLLKFTQALSRPPASFTLRWLKLKRVLHAGQEVLNTMVKMIANPEGVVNLRFLDLTDVNMGKRCHLPFAKAVRHHQALRTLNIVNTGVGSGPDVKRFIFDLLGSESIQILDLGWNCFSADVLSHLGARQVQMQKLKSLGLSNCSATPDAGHATTLTFFLEHLARDYSLRTLDISLNRMDFRAGLVLEDSLTNVKNLTTLNISNNPLGVLGVRNLLRLLCLDSSGLIQFDITNCSTGVAFDAHEGMQVFRKTTPGGRYNLELHRPYHRSLLRMLYKTSEAFGLDPVDSFSNIWCSSPPWNHAQKDGRGVWVVPYQGRVIATFNVDKAVERMMKGFDDYDFQGYMDLHFNAFRTAPGFRKVIPLFGQWKKINGQIVEQMVMLDALAKDFLLTYPQMLQLGSSANVVGETISRLYGCIQGGAAERYLCNMLVKSVPDYIKLLGKIKSLHAFNPSNPNGRYSLDLGNHSEYNVAEKLLLLDIWETGLNMRTGRPDVSQRGNFSVIRNEKYCNRSLAHQVRAMSEWNLPEHDVLELDYSSGRRPPTTATPLDDLSFSNILTTLENSACSNADKLMALRMASHFFYVTALQLRALMGNFKDMESLADMIVLFFVQVIDMHNEKVFRVRVEDDTFLVELRKRIGYIVCLPFIQPEQARFHLDFGEFDQRIAANILMLLSKAENPYNLRNPIYIREDGKQDPLTQGIPRTWEILDKVPKGGSFAISYVCGPDNRNIQARKQFLQTYGFWTLTVEENEIMWWASLKEAPNDVLIYLEFLIARFETIEEAFTAITGDDGVISLRTFEISVRDMGCRKFEGRDENQRIESVFRWLDPSGEGQVSMNEFSVLKQLFKEILQSISEFVEYCERAFGRDLANSWVILDSDQSGEIDKHEWEESCAQIGYRGPVMPIFDYLDRDGEGNVSQDEFQELAKFQKKR